MKNVVVILNSSSILLALHHLETRRERRGDEVPSFPLGELYSRVTEENEGNFVALSTFNNSIEELENAGLVTVTTTKTEPTQTEASNKKTATTEQPTITTQPRTICLTTAGRNLAENHPEWSSIEVSDQVMVAGSGRR